MRARLRLGVAGCGDIAGFTALVSRLVPRVVLAAACDLDAPRLAAFARRHRVPKTYGNYDDMVAAGGLDAVYLALPHDLHLPLARAAIGAGLPVLVEKPLARGLAEGRALVAAAEGAGVKVGVNYQYRYDAACYALRGVIVRGELGAVRQVRINVPWRRGASYFEGSPWHRSLARAGGGTLLTQGSHFLDVALWALGRKAVAALGSVSSTGFGAEVEVETLAQGIVELEGGCLVSISSTMVAAREGAVSIEVYGEAGTAVYRNRPWPRLEVRLLGYGARGKGRGARLPVRGVHALQRSLAGFADWVLSDRPYLVPAAEALPVLAAVEGIYRSARSGRREALG